MVAGVATAATDSDQIASTQETWVQQPQVIRTWIRNQNVANRATIDDSDESKVSFDLSSTAVVLDLVPGVDEGSYEKRAKSRTKESWKKR